MEKKKRHYPLERIKKLVFEGNWRATAMALANAWTDFGFLQSDIRDVLLRLGPRDFYKSMTSHADAAYWQDVYRPVLNGIMGYLKISIVDDQIVVIQFKRK